MSKHADWLRQELPRWLQDGLIEESQAKDIADRYPTTSDKPLAWSILTTIGSLIFGLGIILFFAYNWSILPKAVKLALIFAALLMSHGLAIWFRRQLAPNTNLIEGFHLLGTMIFGAGIWLIAQIYHMDEHYPTALMLWGLGALTLAWAMPSVMQGLLAIILLTAWGLSEITDFSRVHLISVGLIALFLLPLAWRQRSSTLLALALLSTLALTLFNITQQWSNFDIVFKLVFCSALIILAASHWSKRTRFPDSATTFTGIGALFYGFCLLGMSFNAALSLDPLTDLAMIEPSASWYITLSWTALVTTSLIWLILLIASWQNPAPTLDNQTLKWQRVFILLSVLILMIYQLDIARDIYYALSVASNAVLVAHCVLLIIRGTDQMNIAQVSIGLIVLCLLIAARFIDLFDSLLLRSLAFLLIGTLLFFVGHLYSKRKQRETPNA